MHAKALCIELLMLRKEHVKLLVVDYNAYTTSPPRLGYRPRNVTLFVVNSFASSAKTSCKAS